jgi:DNA-binding transcriptional regulator GbsR (MarR family)
MEEQKDIIMQASGFVILPRLSIKNLRDKFIFYYLLEQADWNTGEAVLVLSQLEEQTGWSRKEISNSLSRLQKGGVITMETLRGKRGIKVKIANYSAYQNLSKYRKTAQANGKMAQADDSEKPCLSWDLFTNKSEVEQANSEMVQAKAQANGETVQLIYINNNKNSNINSSNNNKPNTSLVSEKDIETFVDENIDVLPSGVNRKLLIRYCDMLRLTRSTCKISRNILLQVFAKMKKYSANQINFAVWHHVEKHDDKREQYTLGILRNTSDDEAYRKLMRMLNRQSKDTFEIRQSKGGILSAARRELDPAFRDEINSLSF